jgi:hypothetical protein
VDGIHLTDLGFYNLYLYLNKYLRNLKWCLHIQSKNKLQ